VIVPLDVVLPFLVGGPALAQKTIFGTLAGLLVAGAAYLVYLGVQALRASRRPRIDAVLLALGLRVAVERR
jgi:threonine/homoserine/homoserine lactone efflux protein